MLAPTEVPLASVQPNADLCLHQAQDRTSPAADAQCGLCALRDKLETKSNCRIEAIQREEGAGDGKRCTRTQVQLHEENHIHAEFTQEQPDSVKEKVGESLASSRLA